MHLIWQMLACHILGLADDSIVVPIITTTYNDIEYDMVIEQYIIKIYL